MTRKTLVENFNFLKQLCKSKGRKALLENASKSNIKAVCEICLNLLCGNIYVNEKTKIKLKKYREPIELLANKRRLSLAKKKVVLNQKGGFVGLLAGLALPIVTSLVARALSKKRHKRKKISSRK